MIYTNKQAPGVMIYFDLQNVFSSLPAADAGTLIKSILDYAKDGIQPDFANNLCLNMIWSMIQGRIDRDQSKYSDMILQNAYKSYKADCKRKNITPASYDDWREAQLHGVDIRTQPQQQTSSTGSTGEQPSQVVDEIDGLEFVVDDEVLPF